MAAFTRGSVWISTWRVMAPMTISFPSCRMPFSSAMPEMSISALGRFSRCFSAGSRVCPPEISRASGSASSATASAMEEGL